LICGSTLGCFEDKKGSEMADIWNKYADTAARKHGKPGREVRPKSLTLDMHAHVAVPRVAEIVTPHLKQATDPLVAASTPETQALMAKQAADIRTRMSTTDERFAVMDEMGVDMQLICPAPPQIYYYLPLDVGVQAARVLNDGIAEYVGKHKERLVALGGVPMQDGNEAAKELERGMTQLGF
jgi:aminocarboxymuconate-semialdehyde decarboxylase